MKRTYKESKFKVVHENSNWVSNFINGDREDINPVTVIQIEYFDGNSKNMIVEYLEPGIELKD